MPFLHSKRQEICHFVIQKEVKNAISSFKKRRKMEFLLNSTKTKWNNMKCESNVIHYGVLLFFLSLCFYINRSKSTMKMSSLHSFLTQLAFVFLFSFLFTLHTMRCVKCVGLKNKHKKKLWRAGVILFTLIRITYSTKRKETLSLPFNIPKTTITIDWSSFYLF